MPTAPGYIHADTTVLILSSISTIKLISLNQNSSSAPTFGFFLHPFPKFGEWVNEEKKVDLNLNGFFSDKLARLNVFAHLVASSAEVLYVITCFSLYR